MNYKSGKFARKIISSLSVLLVFCVVVAGIYFEPNFTADASSEKTYTVNFENYNSNSGGTMSVVAGFEGVYSGMKSLSLRMGKKGSSQTAHRSLVDTNGNRIELKNGARYVVTYFYKMKFFTGSDKLYAKVDFYGNSASSPTQAIDYISHTVTKWQNGEQFTISKETDWIETSVVFTYNEVSGKENQKYLSIGVYDSSGYGIDMTIDNMVITEITDSRNPLFLNYNDEEKNIDVVLGASGSKHDLPKNPTRNGYVFAGWYSDKELKTAVTQGVFTEAKNNVYAKWLKASAGSTANLTFEKGYSVPANNDELANLKIGSTVAKSGSNSLFYTTDGYTTKNTGQHRLILDNNGNPYKLKDGASYIVTFWYKATEVDNKFSVIKFDFYRTYGNSLTNVAALTSYSADAAKNTQTAISAKTDVWKQASVTFTVNFASKAGLETAEYLQLGAYFGYPERSSCGNVYIDDMTVVELPTLNRAITLVSNNANNEQKIVYGKTGEKMNLPTFTALDGLQFAGWYTDAACTKKYDSEVYPAENTKLYARWAVGYSEPQVNIDFEDYLQYNDFSSTTKAEDSVTLSSEQAHSGKYALKVASNGNWRKSGQAFLYEGKNTLGLEPGATYAITYYFYVIPNNYTNMVVLHFGTSSPASRSTAFKKQSYWENQKEFDLGPAYTIRWNTETGVWHKWTTIITADCTDSSNALSFLSEGPKDARTFYIDDISITKIEKGNNYVFFDSNNLDGKNYVAQGKVGANIALPTPERKGHTFDGWYTSTEFKAEDKYDGSSVIPKESTRLYAKWLRTAYFQDFENYTLSAPAVDRDYELYSADKNNIKNGKYSMHRIGNSNNVKRFTIMGNKADRVDTGKAYIVTMWLKVAKCSDQSAMLKLVNTKALYNPWSADMSSESVIRLSSIADGKWHQVAYKITVIDPFLALEIPGGSDVYVDDIGVYASGFEPKLDDGTIIVTSSVTEDVPTDADNNSSLPDSEINADTEEEEEETTTVIKRYKTKKKRKINKDDNMLWLYILIPIIIVIAAGAVLTFIGVKKGWFKKLLKRRAK